MSSNIFQEESLRYKGLFPVMRLLAIWAASKKFVARRLYLKKPEVNSVFFDGVPVCRSIKEGAATWKALNIIYNYNFQRPRSVKELLAYLWLKSPNAQAVRNRHRLTRHEILQAIRVSIGEVRILSLACGSAQGLLDAVSHAVKQNYQVRCMLVDIDESALKYAMGLAQSLGIADRIETRQLSVTSAPILADLMMQFRPHIVEMMGLLDYLKNKKAINLFRVIRQGLPPKGKFFTGNILPNGEQHFLKHVLDWEMVYREREEFHQLFVSAGFKPPRVIIEPMGIHMIGISDLPEDQSQVEVEKKL